MSAEARVAPSGAAPTSPITPAGVSERTIVSLFRRRMAEHADRVLLLRKVDGRWTGTTGSECLALVRRIALGLFALGVRVGDRAGILADTCPEWGETDIAILCLRGVTVGVYATMPPPQVEYVLHHSESRVAFCGDRAQLEKVLQVWDRLPALEHVVLFKGEPDAAGLPESRRGRVLSFADLEKRGQAEDARDGGLFDRLASEARPEDLVTIIYTSGTTGPPKGAMLTHANMYSVCEATARVLPATPDDIGVCFLPLAHSLQRVANYAGLYIGTQGAYAPTLDAEGVVSSFREVRPTIQASVPRIWEKLHTRIHSEVAKRGAIGRAIFGWALEVGRRWAENERRCEPQPLGLRLKHALADRVAAKLRAKVFGGRVKFLTSGGAPISVEVLEFFHALGLLVLEGYGLTETAAPATINRVERFKFGTVGKAIPGVELKIAEDGEILIKGPGVFKGYYRDEAATRAAFTDDGWFKSGDVGEIDGDGFLKITDRKKDLIITSSGKNISPQNIENSLKESPYVSQALAHGDKRSYLVALITLDADEIQRFARERGLDASGGVKALAVHPEVARMVQGEVDRVNAQLARIEQIKKFRILDEDFSQESGTLTPTMKLKRREIEKRYKDTIDALYGPGGE